MKFLILFVALSFVYGICGDVEVLTEDNFKSFIADNEFVLVEFYAPWCGHCKKLEPEYNKAAQQLKTAGSPVRLAKVDATVETSLASQFEIQGYPTLKWFRKGKDVEYDGGRTAADLVRWVEKKSGPPSKELTTESEVAQFIAGQGTRGLAFLSDASSWVATAEDPKLALFSFAHVKDSSLFGGRAEGTIELHKEGEAVLTYGGEGDLTKWFLAEGFPLVDELSQDSWTRALSGGSDLLAVFLAGGKDDSHYVDVLEVAKANKGEFVSTWSAQVEIAGRWGSSGSVVPTAIYVKNDGGRPSFVVWNEDVETSFNAERLAAFVAGSRDGSYDSFMKSEPIPAENDGPVTVVVGKTFKEIVYQPKDVLVEFYAPWCGHCKKLAPVYDELGAAYKDDGNVVIAKIDATANGLPQGISVQGFPTIILFTANGAQKSYDGERDLESFTTWIEANRSTKKDAALELEHGEL